MANSAEALLTWFFEILERCDREKPAIVWAQRLPENSDSNPTESHTADPQLGIRRFCDQDTFMTAMKQDGIFSLLGSVLVALLLFGARLLLDQDGTAPPVAQGPQKNGQVTAVLDGDTIDVVENGKSLRLRFAGIDTPEKSQPFGPEAKAALDRRVGGKVVRFEVRETDRYGRSIADIYDEQGHVNLWLVEDGFAWHYKAFSKDQNLADAEKQARAGRKGLWGSNRPVEPWNWRKLSSAQRARYQ